jgi:hypothetical protein
MFWWWMPFMAPLEAMDDDADQTQHVKTHPASQNKHQEHQERRKTAGKRTNKKTTRRKGAARKAARKKTATRR